MSKAVARHATVFFFAFFVAFIVIAQIIFFSKIQFAILGNHNICNNKNAFVKLSIVGDLLIGSGRTWQQIVGDDYGPDILGDYFDILKKSDLVFANFEGIISKDGKPRAKNLPVNFSLRTDPTIIRFLAHLDNLILSFANNHSADFGYDAIKETIDTLEKTKIGFIGIGRDNQKAFKSYVKEISGMRVAFLAFTDLLPREYYASETRTGVAELTEENLRAAIALVKQSADFIIVSLHTAEDVATPFSFWPDSHQKLFSRLAIDYGADLVVGQHPHGLQQAEKYREKLIFYSLGLFLYDPSVSQRYESTNPLFRATQFKGGGVLTLEICQDGIRGFTLMPTKTVYSEKGLRIEAASLLKRVITGINILQL